jgi:hypothetical protein
MIHPVNTNTTPVSGITRHATIGRVNEIEYDAF